MNNKIYILFITLFLPLIITAQGYTWEKYHTTYTGGYQTAGNYTSYVSPNWFYSGTVSNADNEGYTGFLTPKLDVRPPRIDSIFDIPNDQGRWVQIVWDKSGYDDTYSQDNFYSIWREDDDLTGKDVGLSGSYNINEVLDNASIYPKTEWYWLKDGTIWTYIDLVPALVYEQYAYVAPTLKDSIAPDNMYFSTFKIVFHDTYNYYESVPDSGYSVDNIAPFAPVVAGQFKLNFVLLDWDENEAEDFQYFALYRSYDPENFPEIPYETTTDTVFHDNELVADHLYYKVTAFDSNGNESEYSNMVSIETTLKLELKVLLEGPFSANTMSTDLNDLGIIPHLQPYNVMPWNYTGTESAYPIPNENIVDWVLVELRDAASAESADPSTVINRKAAFLMNDGTIVSTDGSEPLYISGEVDQNLFVIIWHRNHLGIMSAINMVLTDGIVAYDFSLNESTVYGGTDGIKQLGADSWGMISGDANADGVINSGDKINTWNMEAGTTGYLPGDLNLNGQINNPDKNEFWLLNFGNECQVPE